MNQDYLRRIQDSRRAPTVARKSIAKRRTTTLPAYSSGFRIHKRGAKAEAPQAPRSSAVGAKIEAPRAPMGWGVGTGMPLPRKKMFDSGSQNGDFMCILGTILQFSYLL